MHFQVRVETFVPGIARPFGDEMVVDAANETDAGERAKLQARDKHPGGNPIVRGTILPLGASYEQKYEPIPIPEDNGPAREVVHAATEDKTPGLRDYDRPSPKTYAEWKALPWLSLKKYAVHAARDTAAAPKNSVEALVILQERGLVKP